MSSTNRFEVTENEVKEFISKMSKNNVKIAKYIGSYDETINDPKWIENDGVTYLKFHKSWDALMPVVQKIKKEIIDVYDRDLNNMGHLTFQMFKTTLFLHLQNVNMNKIYETVVEIIDWHNQVEKDKIK